MSQKVPRWMVRKKSLIAIAGAVWCAAGFNVSRLGWLAYRGLKSIYSWHFLLSGAVFTFFGKMFFAISSRHISRITECAAEFRPFWTFFDIKSYLLMIFMMSGGIWLRSAHIAPELFIAVFYTGLGLALTLAGVSFLLYLLRTAVQLWG